ncbi:SET domain-containing protein [Seiridium cupressi]
MASPETAETHSELSQYIARVLLERCNWSLDSLDNPVLRIEAHLEEGTHGEQTGQSRPVFRHVVDLSDARTTRQQSRRKAASQDAASLADGGHVVAKAQGRPAGKSTSTSSARPTPEAEAEADQDHDSDTSSGGQRKGTGGLRPARSDSAIDEDVDSQRQIHSGDKFPKRRRVKPEGHFLQPSTLDKLIGGIWEQIHGSLSLDPQSLVQQLQIRGNENGMGGLVAPPPMSALQSLAAKSHDAAAAAASATTTAPEMSDAFSRSNIFCRQVTQASRACRSLEVIVQARWVEYFETYVDSWAHANPSIPRSRYNKAALMGACADFGWTEKELRNKMYVWRGYKEIKDAGGWAALVFAGMGIYRFCKYRIGFDGESMLRLKNLRLAMEVAADTLHPQWRQLLTVLGESSENVFHGHPHDWVVQLDGSDPIPLRNTYLQWDPAFSYRHLDEPVVDEAVWGCDDPRWSAPTGEVVRTSAHPICETCGKDQSDDPKLNSCYCFPTLFGCANSTTSPVLVFRTPDGKNNGLLALCAFERGAPIGEFIGVITKGFRDVDVMESTTPSSGNYQIWQGRQGNFTRFVNHSCKANAQYQRFTWLSTQRIILVSKGIDAGTEITVDYSDKYWKGLDKKCLCGETCCMALSDLNRRSPDAPHPFLSPLFGPHSHGVLHAGLGVLRAAGPGQERACSDAGSRRLAPHVFQSDS